MVLWDEPALVPALLREALGVELPPYERVEVGSSDFTQAMPTEFRADLVVYLRGPGPAHVPVLAIVVEVQRQRDDAKRFSWPLYAAALHATSRCPTYLLVIATEDAVADWAAQPIATLQPSSPFCPLVLRPEQVPRVTVDRAEHDPWMAILSAVIHGNRSGGLAVAEAALNSLHRLDEGHASFYSRLIVASLRGAVKRTLEMHMGYEYMDDIPGFGIALRRREERGMLAANRDTLLAIAERRIGPLRDAVKERVMACADAARLRELVVEIGVAPDRETVERLLATLD
jgi:hypothetical protein